MHNNYYVHVDCVIYILGEQCEHQLLEGSKINMVEDVGHKEKRFTVED